MAIKFVGKNDYRYELEIRGFPIDPVKYEKMIKREREREEEMEKRHEENRVDCKQMTIKW